MAVQDDERERELVRIFNLSWDSAHQRGGVDALLNVSVDGKPYELEVEVKSSTTPTISTARDVGIDHIRKWRERFFVLGFYAQGPGRPELKRCLCLTPIDMEPWIESIEKKILIDFRLAALSASRLNESDLFAVCEEKASYSIADAKRLHKNQWSRDMYEAAQDLAEGGEKRISKMRMLEILRLRSQYIAERGATLNNPHITSEFLKKFFGTSREVAGTTWARTIGEVATEFIRMFPEHPAIRSG